MKAAARTNIVCYVTDRKDFPPAHAVGEPAARVLGTIRVAIQAGVDWVQIREKDLPSRELFELAREAVAAAGDFSAGGGVRAKSGERTPRVIINDRLDIALAGGADGVHLGHESAPVRAVVRWCRAGNAPPGFLIGISCHSPADLREAEDAGANYAFFGPIFETPSKKVFGSPQGIERLVEVCRSVAIPVIAIGGVNEENAAHCIRAGAAGIAAIRMFQRLRDEKTMADEIALLRHLD